jgi:hypothetical protein
VKTVKAILKSPISHKFSYQQPIHPTFKLKNEIINFYRNFLSINYKLNSELNLTLWKTIKFETVNMKADCSQFNWVHEFPIIFTKRIISKIESACFKRDCKEMTLCRDNQYFIIVLFIDFIISKQESSSLLKLYIIIRNQRQKNQSLE